MFWPAPPDGMGSANAMAGKANRAASAVRRATPMSRMRSSSARILGARCSVCKAGLAAACRYTLGGSSSSEESAMGFAFRRALAIACACIGCAAFAADTKPPAKLDEPMAGNMKKPGMKQGDVKKQAEKKSRAMKPKLEKEEKDMARERK